nr:nucleoprotein TPR [Cryptococcus depauperatus CBS 7855]
MAEQPLEGQASGQQPRIGVPAQTQPSEPVPLPEDIRAEVEREQAFADAQQKIKELAKQLQCLQEEKDSLTNKRDSTVSLISQLRTQLSDVQSSHHEATSKISVLQMRLDASEREKRELFEETERIQQRLNKIIQELYTLRQGKTDAAQKIASLDVEFNEKMSTQSLESARKEIITLSKAVSEVEERFGRYRAEAATDQSQFRSEKESLLARLSTVEQSYRSLQRTYNDQSSRLADAHANIATLTSAAAANKAAVAVEVLQMEEANRILEKRSDEARQTIADREAELERMAEQLEDREKYWEARFRKEERLKEESERRAQELKVVADRLDMAEGHGGFVSASAAVAGEVRKNGKSYTQLYADYTIQESRLRTTENEVERLTDLLDEISQELNEKKPLLDEQAIEHARAIERANALATELSTVISERDAFQSEIKSLRAASSQHASDVSFLQTTVEDLSHQVKTLLRQIAIKDDPSLASVPIDSDAEVGPTGDIVTDNLLEFKSIRSLQEQNQRLLKITRSLMSKLDEREIARAAQQEDENQTSQTLDQATEMIKKLHKDLLESQKKVNEVSRERDFFSKLLAKGDGLKWSQNGVSGTNGPLEDNEPRQQIVVTLQAELDVLREKTQGEVQVARQEIRKKTEEAARAEVERAKAEAKIGLLEEQARALNEASSLQKDESKSLENQVRQLQGAIAQAHNEQRAALDQVATKQAEADRLRNEAAMLRAEKEQWKSIESRLHSDFCQVQSERIKLQQLIDSLRTVVTEADKTRIEERETLEKRVESLQRETVALRQQIEEAHIATRAAEKMSSEFQARIESATVNLRADKEAAEALIKAHEENLVKLRAECDRHKSDSETKQRIGLNWKKRADQLLDQIAETTKIHDAAMLERDNKLAEAEEKVKGVNEEIESFKKRIEELERINGLKEGTVQRLQSELTKAQSNDGQGNDLIWLTWLWKTILRKEKDELAEKLVKAELSLEAAKANTEATVEIEGKRYDTNVTKVNRINASMKAKIVALESERNSLNGQVNILNGKVIELENKIKGLESSVSTMPSESVPAAAGETIEAKSSQEEIDAAVQVALAARENELQIKFAKDLEEATSSAAAAASLLNPATASELAAPIIDAEATAKRIAELEATFKIRVNEAIQSQKGALEGEIKQLKGQVEELKNKVKSLERQVKTAEISRKTLERQKADVEKKLNEALKDEKGEIASKEDKPTEPKEIETTPTTTLARGSSIRGRGRGTAARGKATVAGRPNSILSAVNATLSQTSPPAPANETSGVKRPLPEDGEISPVQPKTEAIEQAAPAGTAERPGRVLKRPRGGATRGRGGRGGGPGASTGGTGN